jgi:cellulose synthase/poly-beta-1,6-N-acetylglucosamine synthase-like glycosyltransferase
MLVAAVIIFFLVPATLAAGAYALLTSFGFVRAPSVRRSPPTISTGNEGNQRFTVLIPAHNEETVVGDAIRSVRADDPSVPVHVVADNCTDGTAGAARTAGAVVFERSDSVRWGKGYALAFGLAEILRSNPAVVVILDADGTLAPGGLAALARTFATGAEAAQVRVRSGNPGAGPAGLIAAVGCEVDATTAAGRDRLGLTVPLRGTGMAFTTSLLLRHPWAAFGPAEDAEYARTLAAAGVRVRYVPDAVVSSDAPSDPAMLLRQRRRWRAALTPVTVRTFASSKPLVLLHLTATLAATAVAGSAALFGWAMALLLLTGVVYLRALVSIGFSPAQCPNLLRMPGLVLRLAGVTAAGAVAPPADWDRTPTAGEPCRTAA